MSTERETIAVIGTGYVGLVTAAGFAELGSEVWCVDVDAEKIARLQAGEIPIWEPGLRECVERNRERMHFTTDLAPALEHARLLFVAVGTPPTYSGDADLSAVHAVVDAMPASDGHALVMKSTVPVGTGASIERELAERGKRFSYVSCPEFLKEGSALQDFLHPDRVVVGDRGDWAGDAVVELYAPLDAPLVRTDVASAEMVKLASNAFLATKISFINEIANVCEETGANVLEVARGMGLDQRIGSSFLRPGIGFGGSCLTGDETVLARRRGRTTLLTLEALWDEAAAREDEVVEGLLEPEGLDVLSWLPDRPEPLFMPVACLTRRDYEGEILTVHTKMGRRVRCTPDHPWITRDGNGAEEPTIKLAERLGTADWLPLAGRRDRPTESPEARLSLLGAVEDAGLDATRIHARPRAGVLDELHLRPGTERARVFAHPRGWSVREGDVRRSGTLRVDEAARAGLDLRGCALGTASNGNFVDESIKLDERFWRVVGLYIAEGCTAVERSGRYVRYRPSWSFHPSQEEHLVDEVASFWLLHGVRARTYTTATSRLVTVSSRLLGAWWLHRLGLGRTSYEQRLPDLIWDMPDSCKWALLSGLFEGDGSWSLQNGGPSVVIELGTVSDELADGVLRLLADLGVVAGWKRGYAAKSTKETHWIRVSGAEQIERAIDLVPARDRVGVLSSIARQRKRIASTGSREMGGSRWARVTRVDREAFAGHVYSMEVPAAHTVVGTACTIHHNCFPKDVSALKQLAGNSGYHFQLLTSVIEVNELQKRRVVQKLQKHLGTLVGKKVALLGLAFKPNTDDMREASSLVLAARLQADGAQVAAYDPVAEEEARKLIRGVRFADGALDALEGADAAVIVTEWPEFGEIDWGAAAQRMAGRLVIDGRNCLDAGAVRSAGFTYEGVGQGA